VWVPAGRRILVSAARLCWIALLGAAGAPAVRANPIQAASEVLDRSECVVICHYLVLLVPVVVLL
jgi:hypothetical protein